MQVNCRGYDAFGRKKRAITQPANKTDLAVLDSPLDGQLREEITIQSNAILTIERRDPARISDPTEGLFQLHAHNANPRFILKTIKISISFREQFLYLHI